MKCRVCEKTIRGNASREDYDEARQVNTYVCRRCDRLMELAIPKPIGLVVDDLEAEIDRRIAAAPVFGYDGRSRISKEFRQLRLAREVMVQHVEGLAQIYADRCAR